MESCCSALKNLLDNAGRRGFAVLVENSEEGVKFLLQMRAVDFSDQVVMMANPQSSSALPEHVTLASSVRIKFCPACGSELALIAKKCGDDMRRLAEEHRQYRPKW